MTNNSAERPMIFSDPGQIRELQLFGDPSTEYAQGDVAAIEGLFTRITEHDEFGVLSARIRHESEHNPARLAVDLVVQGSHSDLHRRAKKWTKLLRQTDSLGPMYTIDH